MHSLQALRGSENFPPHLVHTSNICMIIIQPSCPHFVWEFEEDPIFQEDWVGDVLRECLALRILGKGFERGSSVWGRGPLLSDNTPSS